MSKYEWIGVGVFILITLGVIVKRSPRLAYAWFVIAVVGGVVYAATNNK